MNIKPDEKLQKAYDLLIAEQMSFSFNIKAYKRALNRLNKILREQGTVQEGQAVDHIANERGNEIYE